MISHMARLSGLLGVAIAAFPVAAGAEESAAGLAQKLTNPIADLVTVPIQLNLDRNIGPTDDGTKLTTNIQPVIPFDVGLSKLFKLGKPPVSLQGGAGYWAESPDAGPEGFRFRLQANVVLPR